MINDPRGPLGITIPESGRRKIEVRAVDSARDAIEGAAIVCAVSSSREPVLAQRSRCREYTFRLRKIITRLR